MKPILGLGLINLKTGRSKYFNIYDTWGEDTTYEVYQVESHKVEPVYKIVATSGTKPLGKMGEMAWFKHDQTGRFLFHGKMIDFAVGADLKSLAAKYGNNVSGFTYK